MPSSFSELSLSTSTTGYVLSVLVLAAILWLSWNGYRKNPGRLTFFLESLRIVIVLLVLFLLARPEWVTRHVSEKNPEIFILWDDSQSMVTQDVEQGKTTLVSRQEGVKNILDSHFWKPLEEKNTVNVIPFSSPGKDAEGNISPMSGTDLSAALEQVMSTSENLRAVILISDGDHNLGNPPAGIAQRYRNRDIPVYSLPIGSEVSLPDIAIENVRPPAYGVLGESVQIPFTISNSLGREINTVVTLKSRKGISINKDIKLPAYGNISDAIIWRLETDGSETLELSTPVHAGERSDRNNKISFALSGRRESIRVLIIESEPRWEYRFIRNALYRDPGVEVNTIMFHPALGTMGAGAGYLDRFPEKLEDLSVYDVVFIGDVGIGHNGLTEKQAELLKGLVESQASGIVFLPGRKGNQASLVDSPLASLMPVILQSLPKEGYTDTAPSPLQLTREGQSSLLTLLANTEEDNARVWNSLPGFYWYAPVERVKAGALVLATHPVKRNRYGRIPLLVTQMSGAGKVLYMGTDSAWRWRRGVEDLYHYRFWGQVARWMSYQRNMAAGEKVRIYPDQERPKLGDSVLLTATVADNNGAPLKEGPVYASVIAPDGQLRANLELNNDASAWGVFTGNLKIDQPGEWKVEVAPPDEPDKKVTLTLLTTGDSVEKIGRVSRPDILKEISLITNGRVVSIETLDALTKEINVLPAPKPSETRYLIWCHWMSGLTLLLLLSAFWIGRKINGTI